MKFSKNIIRLALDEVAPDNDHRFIFGSVHGFADIGSFISVLNSAASDRFLNPNSRGQVVQLAVTISCIMSVLMSWHATG